jgi:N-acetylmuramoyl-L-alanine amidase
LPAAGRFSKGVVCALLVLAALFLLAEESRAADVYLLQGEIRKGRVSMMERDGMNYAALDEMLSNLGFASSGVEGGFVVTYSGKKVEFWNGSNIARLSGTVYSMLGVVFSQDGHWWGEAESSLKVISLFLKSVERPFDIRWSSGRSADVPLPKGLEAAPRLNAPPPVTSSRQVLPGGLASITKVRWGEQANAYRAVIDVSEQVDADLKRYPDRVEVTFKKTAARAMSENSPWPPLQVASSQSGDDAVMVFRHDAGRVESFWLTEPPRYVVDFYFGSGTKPAVINATPVGTPAQRGPLPGVIQTRPGAPGGGDASSKKLLIVVDAGHGGNDPGALGNSLREKDINLKASLELSEILKAKGFDVKLTRADDRYLKLAERTAFANNSNADIFISLHCNALPKGKHASGTELYLMAETTDRDALNLAIIENRELSGDAQSAAEINEAADKRTRLLLQILGEMQQNDKIIQSTTLAEYLYDKMRGDGFSIRKVQQAPFFVLRGAGMPALLVEMGYITEAKDANQLNSQAYRKKMMNSLAMGISNYLSNGAGEGGGL